MTTLEPLPKDQLALGGDPTTVLDEYLDVIGRTISNHPRSLQKRIGPSEVGQTCARRLGYKLLDHAEREQKPNWKATIGTAVHSWLEHAFQAENARWVRAGGVERWVTETRVTVGATKTLGKIAGSCDLYDRVTGTVLDHKGLPLDTKIPTPGGWTTQGELAAGDRIFGTDGKPCTVVRTYPVQQRDCFRITFTDGTSFVTDDVQQLTVSVDGKREITDSVLRLRNQLHRTDKRGQRWLRIYNPSPLELPPADLVVHPYVFGCWLGDGGTVHGTIGKPDEELFSNIAACGYEIGRADKRGITRTVHGLQTQLRALGVQWVEGTRTDKNGKNRQIIGGCKQIPIQYLRGSYEQRLALLRGLMDTDGTWNRPRNQAVFTTTNEGLANGVRELVASLGWRARIYPQTAHGFGKTVKAFQVAFVPFGENPFLLPRKADLVRLEGTTRSRYRIIQSIEPTASVETRCIDVDTENHLYLAGPDMIPVHNCVGPAQLRHYKADGPSAQYRTQAHLYGRGLHLLGLPVETVGICFLPRNGELRDAFLWHEPWDEQIALQGLERLEGIAATCNMLGDAALAMLPTADVWCINCPFFKAGSTDPRDGCPGHDMPKAADSAPLGFISTNNK